MTIESESAITKDSEEGLKKVPENSVAWNHKLARKANALARQANEAAKKAKEDAKKKAREWHKAAYIYAIYGALDGYSLSCSIIKCASDFIHTDNKASTNAVRDWLSTRSGKLELSAISIFMIGFSILGNVWEDDDKNKYKARTSLTFKYLRTIAKSMKNAYKGIRSGVQMANRLSLAHAGHTNDLSYVKAHANDLSRLILPLALVLGLLSVFNRVWNLYMAKERKRMVKENKLLLEKIVPSTKSKENKESKESELPTLLSQTDIDADRKTLQGNRQTRSTIRLAYLSAVYTGIVDGLYLFLGPLSLSLFVWPLFLAIAVCSIFFAVACITSRIYEEYMYQRELMEVVAKVELALLGKEMENLFNTLHRLSVPFLDGTEQNATMHAEFPGHNQQNEVDDASREQEVLSLYLQLEKKIEAFAVKRKELQSYVALTNTAAVFAGLRSGLAVYGAIASILFIASMINAALPPLFVLISVLVGFVAVIGFTIHSFVKNRTHLLTVLKSPDEYIEAENHEKLSGLLRDIKKKRLEMEKLDTKSVNSAIVDGMDILPFRSPQFQIMEISEVIRAGFSGGKQGLKGVEVALNTSRVADNNGHFHDSDGMIAGCVVTSVAYSAVLALRAFTKGFKNSEEMGQETKKTQGTEKTQETEKAQDIAAVTMTDATNPQPDDEVPPSLPTDTLPSNPPSTQLHRFLQREQAQSVGPGAVSRQGLFSQKRSKSQENLFLPIELDGVSPAHAMG